jgi:large subunit ribosomal protein L22
MQVQAKLKYLRIAPRKVRLIADLVRGKDTAKAFAILKFSTNKTAPILIKLIKSAVANATNNSKLDENNLYISDLQVCGGPILKRSRPRARGSAFEIQKKTSHIFIKLDEINKGKSKPVKIQTKKEEVSAEKKETAIIKEPKKKEGFTKEGQKTVKAGQKQKVFRRQVF